MLLAGTFKDKAVERSFNELGYAFLPAVLTAKETATLLRLYKEHHTYIKPEQLQWNSLYEVGIEKGLEISQKIKDILDPVLSNIFSEWKLPVATFMSKNPVKNSTCEVHRDFSSLDETKYQYRNIWIPLIDITSENGALYVVPKSHRLFDSVRPMFSNWGYEHLTEDLRGYFKTFYPKAGDMIVYADKTLHGSQLNQTIQSRPVIHAGMLHKEAMLHYYQLNATTNELKIYEVPFEFYLADEFNSHDLDKKYILKDRYTYTPIEIGKEDIHRFCQEKKCNNDYGINQ